jgi:hypothetical protein
MNELEQLQLEWLLINASRELLAITKKNPNVTYADALKFAKDNARKIFAGSTTGLGSKSILEKLYEKFIEEAKAKSLEAGKPISPDDMIRARFEELKRMIKIYPLDAGEPSAMRKEKNNLGKLIKEPVNKISGLVEVKENNALIHDMEYRRGTHSFVNSHLGKFKEYQNKEDGSIFRIAVLHPDAPEVITGADLIYEQYNKARDKVRIVAIQYKIWENGKLYFSQTRNLFAQLDKMKNCFCDEKYCLNEHGEPFSPFQFRLPYCVAFLRPTDKLQDPNKLITTGYHIPVCKIAAMRKSGKMDIKIDVNDIKTTSLKTQSFEEFFNAEMVGSRWLTLPELEHVYHKSRLLDSSDKIILYTQSPPTSPRG